MSSNTPKWLIGCGIGCGVAILLIIILAVGGYFFVKNKIEFVKDIEETTEILEEKYGSVQDFCPEPGGVIKLDRMKIFLTVRDSLKWIRQEIEQSFHQIRDDIQKAEREEKPFWQALKIVRRGFNAIPQLVRFYKIRNEALLETGMGLGEYYYIYVISYYSWLDKSPGDGPEFRLIDSKQKYYNYSVK